MTTPEDLHYESASPEVRQYRAGLLPYLDTIDIFETGQPIKLCLYGSFATGKTTQAVDVMRELLISRHRRGLPFKPLLRVTAETSGNTLVDPLVHSGHMVNVEMQQVCNPERGLTADGFLTALGLGTVWVPGPGGKTRAVPVSNFCALLFEGLDTQANTIGQHVLATGRKISAENQIYWTTNSVDANGAIVADAHRSGAWDKEVYGFAQNTAVQAIPKIMSLPLDAIIVTTHERMADSRDPVPGRNGGSMGRINGPAVVGGAGTSKLLPLVDILLHFEMDSLTAAKGGHAYRIYFETHPDLVNPVVLWQAINRVDPTPLTTLKAYLTGGQPFLTIVPPSMDPPTPGRGIIHLLRAIRHFQREHYNALTQGLPPVQKPV